MTKAPRGPGAPIQLKDSRDTMAVKPIPSSERRSAQLVVCGYVMTAYPTMSERGQITEAKELMDILGLLEM